MDIKNFLYQKKENKKKQIMISILLSLGIIFLGVIIFLVSKNQKRINYNIGDNIYFLGKISYDNNYPINTHKISDTKTTFGLKNSTTNLNNFINKTVLISGIISDIGNKLPILSITEIRVPESKLIIHENKYFFVDELISLDFSKDLDLKAEKIGKNIKIYYQNEPILSIETFVCSKVTSIQDCNMMISNFSENLSEVFTSYFEHIFYKNKEHSRIAFNENTLGYIFKASDSDILLDMSHLIQFYDSKFIIENKSNFIKDNCTLEEGDTIDTMNKINKVNIEIVDENLIKLNINGLNQNQDNMDCKLTINMRDNRDIKAKKISY